MNGAIQILFLSFQRYRGVTIMRYINSLLLTYLLTSVKIIHPNIA